MWLVDIVILLLFLVILFKIIEFACEAFKYPLTPQMGRLLGLVFLLFFLVQVLGVAGTGLPYVRLFYR